MSVQSEIDRINGNVASTYTALSEMGATMPETQNSDNLPATARTVPTGGTSVQTDWNQTDETAADFLKNKPVETVGSDTLTWDGNMTGREFVDIGGAYLVHISDVILAMSDLANGGILGITIEEGLLDVPIVTEHISVMDGVLVHSSMFFAIVQEDNVDVEGLVFPKAGIYVLRENEAYVSSFSVPGAILSNRERLKDDIMPGANVLYVDDTYLYETSDISNAANRVTKSRLQKIIKNGSPVYLSNVSATGYLMPLAFVFVDVYASVFTAGSVGVNTGVTSALVFYTAEYEPPTT